jgi:hypothetical protein
MVRTTCGSNHLRAMARPKEACDSRLVDHIESVATHSIHIPLFQAYVATIEQALLRYHYESKGFNGNPGTTDTFQEPSAMSTINESDGSQSRLDREISEILEEARKRPISFQDRVAQKKSALEAQRQVTATRARSIGTGPARTVASWLTRIPLVTALAVALIAVWVSPDIPVLGVILGLVAAALIFLPFVTRRSGTEFTYRKTWRGRPIEPSRPGGGSLEGTVRSWIDSARNRFGR